MISAITNEMGQKREIIMTGMSFAIVDEYKDTIYRTALTVTGNFADAEDITQEVFLKYFQFRPEFETKAHEKAWLLRVTINSGKNLLRSVWHSRRGEIDLTQIPQPENEKHPEVLQAVLSLPEKYRIAIYLYYYEEYSIQEIAGITGRTQTAIAQHLSRGRAKLRKKLGGGKS
ncbi:MAG TPA: RNA polymerase subunit sigma-24 [Ruminococcus sp.]|nr:RNA polymerase subunit sigma-24 [Ruminococcus sp.]